MNRGRVIVVTGLPGTGKSTLARELARRYQLPLLAKDFIKEPLFDVLGAPDAAQSRRLSDASFATMFRLAAEWAHGGHSFVLEGNFRPGEHDSALRAALESAQVMQVLCTVSEPERLARLTARKNDPSRHPGHRLGERLSTAGSAAFLDLRSERFVHDTAAHYPVLAVLDDWMNLGAASPSASTIE
jgi:predicted kinase